MRKPMLIRKKAKNLWRLRPGQQIITIPILHNISRSKVSQTMKFGQLIEYSMRNIFLEKSYTKRGGEASPRPFKKYEHSTYL